MTQYRKKPVVIEAFQYGKDPRPDWFTQGVTIKEVFTFPDHCLITTLEGNMRGDVGDYIIKGVQNEIYPCKPDVFEMTYEKIN
jgi:hypothetical protein